MGYLRRIPLALLVAYAAFVIVAVVYRVVDLDREILGVTYVVDVAAVILLPIGLFTLAGRASVREVEMGATLAGAAAAGGALLFVGSVVLRDSEALRWVRLATHILEAIGFAVMIGRRSLVLAIAEIAIVVGGALAFRAIHLPSAVLAVQSFVHLGIELTILALVSPAAEALGDPHIELSRPMDRARQLAIASALVYATSLCLPAVRTHGFQLVGPVTSEEMWGVACLLIGWVVLPCWLANPLLLVGAILLAVRRPRGALAFGCAAIVSALTAPVLLLGAKADTQAMLVGYYVWLASMVIFTAAAYQRIRARRLADPMRIV